MNVQATQERAAASDSHDDDDTASLVEQAPTYFRFGAMVLTSTFVMLGLTYTNVWGVDHIYWSEERFYMAILMGAAMAIVMMAFMWGMHKRPSVNIAIIAGAMVVFSGALWLSRSQHFVDDQDYMGGMIPHHSIAILTSERADIQDVRVRELADEITATQRREIAEMEWLIDDISENGFATSQEEADDRPVPDFGE